jgi:spore coat protein U-like protein
MVARNDAHMSVFVALCLHAPLGVSVNKFALVALAGAFALSPIIAIAGTHTDNGPAQSGGQGETVQYGQGKYLHTHADISMDIPAFCTSVSADDVAFGSIATALNPSATRTLQVRWNCVDQVRPIVAFESPTNKCHLKGPSPNTISQDGIPYSITSSQASTTELCNADASAPPSLYYPAQLGEDGNNSHTFYVKTGSLIADRFAKFPVGTYTDTVQIYLSF